jgi:2-oxoisovalerate dehydrogenase E2 component (dihydrolipoyl transacylase)
MPVSITMPQLGESVAEGTIGKWLKQVGETIGRDEPLVEIITDKVTAEMPSPTAGIVESIAVDEGETVPVGTTIAVIGDNAAGSAEGSPEPEQVAEPVHETGSAAPTSPSQLRDSGGEHRASPLVRRLAQEHSVNISAIEGTGSGGRVTKQDILAYIENRPSTEKPEAAVATTRSPDAQPGMEHKPTTAPQPILGEHDELVPLSTIRRAIAEHMVRSVTTAPHAWCLVEVDVTELVSTRERLLKDWQDREGFELTFVPFFIKTVTESLREHPIINSSWSDAGIIMKGDINIGLAVAVEDGLIVPVIHNADRQSIAGLAHIARDLVVRARQRQLQPADVQGGTFTVNNTGALGSIMSAPIIPQPQAGIVTMEAIVKRPVVRDDAIAIRSMMNVCMSFDHRVTDGAQGLRFLQSVRRRLESFNRDTSLY